MALRYCNGFDGPVPLLGLTPRLSGGTIVSGRNGNGMLVGTAPDNVRYDNGPTATSRLIFGCAVRCTSGSMLDGAEPGLFSITGYISTIGWPTQYGHLSIRVNADGSLELRLGPANGTVLATGPVGTVHTDGAGWNYIEVDATIDPTAGHVIIRVDGFEVINYTGNTEGDPTHPLIENVYFGGADVEGSVVYDDFYVCDVTGTVNNTFLGEVRVDTVLPNGNGARSELFGSDADAVDNYLLVDDPTADATDWVESAAPGDGDTYTFVDIPGTRDVLAAQVVTYSAKDDTGARSAHALARSGVTEVAGADFVLQTTFSTDWTPFDTAPDGTDWDATKFNAAEFGYEIAS